MVISSVYIPATRSQCFVFKWDLTSLHIKEVQDIFKTKTTEKTRQ